MIFAESKFGKINVFTFFDDNFEKIDIKYDDMKYLGKENQADNELVEKLEHKENSVRRITKDMRRALKFAMKRGDVRKNFYFKILKLFSLMYSPKIQF